MNARVLGKYAAAAPNLPPPPPLLINYFTQTPSCGFKPNNVIKPGTNADNLLTARARAQIENLGSTQERASPRTCSSWWHRNWAGDRLRVLHRCRLRALRMPVPVRRKQGQVHRRKEQALRRLEQGRRSWGLAQRTPGQGRRTSRRQVLRIRPRHSTRQSFPGEGWRGWRLKIRA